MIYYIMHECMMLEIGQDKIFKFLNIGRYNSYFNITELIQFILS